MTFYEAAIEVLRRSGRPLHYKKITELAIRDSLLSHVGKTPEVTMSARLNQEVKREEHSALLRPRPGIFTLRDDVAKRLNDEAAERERLEAETQQAAEQDLKSRNGRKNEPAPPTPTEEEDEELDEEEDEEQEDRSSRRDAKKMAYPEDPELFDDQGQDGPERGERSSRSRRRRRSRGRRSRDRGEETSTSSQEESSRAAAPAEEAAPARSERNGSERVERNGSDRSERSGSDRGERGERNGRGRNGAGARERHSNNDAPRAAAQENHRSNGKAAAAPAELDEIDQKHLEHGPVRLEGLAQAAHTVLQESGKTLEIQELATAIFKRKLVKFHTHDPGLTVQAALVNDNQLRARRGHRELFVRYANNRWGLSEWGLTPQTLRKEQQILSLSEECRQEALRHLGKALMEVKTEALEQTTLTMLEGMGYRNIKVSKRSSNGDVFFSADWRQGLSDLRVCIQLTGESDEELVRDAVTDLRGTLHHYAAHEGVIIHFGDISNQAVEESREAKLANITLIDRKTFVELLVDQGIGIKRYHTPILVVDKAYIDELLG